jgi:competence protein ComEC
MLRAAGGEPMAVRRAVPHPSRRRLMTDFVHKTLARRLSPPAAALWSSTALGETSFLPPQVSDAFRATGLFHLLAVSGSHMLLLGGAIFAALRLLRAPSRFAWIFSCLGVWLYTWLLEWPAPVLRASIAYTVLAAAMAGGRRPHPSNAWFLSAACLLCLDPNSPFHPGVQLSFAAVAGLLWVAPHLEWMLPHPLREGRVAAWFSRPLVASLGASLTTAPLLAWHFQAVPWIGIPVGLATALFFEAGFLASLLTLLLSGIGLPVPFFWGFAKAADGMAWICLESVLWSAEHFHGRLDLARPAPALVLLGMGFPLALALWGTAWRRLALWGGVSWMAAAGAFWIWPQQPLLEAWFLDVGQGDAALLRFPSGRAWLVDCGPRSQTSDAGARVVLPALRTLGIRSLDAVVVTHPDMDHAGGLDTLIGALPIGRVLVPAAGYPDTPAHWTGTLARLSAKGIPVREIGAGQRLSYGDGVRSTVLAPGRGEAPSTNGASVVLRTEYGRSSMLLAGDAEFWSERHQLQDGARLSADLLKVGHHGSRTSSGPEWLNAVHPGLALLSTGAFNRYGHPSPEFLERLRGIGSASWITAHRGGLYVRIQRGGMRVAAAEPRWWRGPWRRR